MATNFPSSLDTFTNPSSSDLMNSVTVPHNEQHANANDAIEALQAKVGVDSSADTSSLEYRVGSLETFPIQLNGQTVSADYTIPSGYNGVSAGPITIADGVTVTVSSGSEWSIV